MKRAFLISIWALVLVLCLAIPAWAWDSSTSDATDTTTTVAEPPTSVPSDTTTATLPPTTAPTGTTSAASTTEASQGVTVTMDASDVGTYQISLLGSDLDFTVTGLNQLVESQNPLSIVNSGTASFDVYVSADSPPSSGLEHQLSFSDSPGHNQVRWSLAAEPDAAQAVSVTDTNAAGFGALGPGQSITLYSYLQMGSGLDYPGVYGWHATVYAVPGS